MSGPSAIARLLTPRSVAVIGASADPGKTAGRPVAYLQKHGFAGAIYPVNPRYDQIAGLPCYRDVESVPDVPDVGIVLLGVERAADAVAELARRGTAAAIVLASGYAEAGPEGARRQAALKEAAGGMRLLGPNTIGLVNVVKHITLSASAALEIDTLPSGSIALVSQSGGILGALLSRAAARGVGFSSLVATSNEADLELSDFVEYFVDDEATSVIALYLEGIRDVPRFRAAALRAAAAGKPVVAFKVGRSESGARSAASHTGVLAGADRLYDALFKQVGVIRVNTFSDMLDVAPTLAAGRRLGGNRVAILTSTGGAATLLADSFGLTGIDCPPPDDETGERLRALDPGRALVLDRNPIDVTLAGLQPELLRRAIAVLLASPTYDGVVVVVGSSALAMPGLMAGAITDSLATSGKPVLAYVSPHAPDIGRLLSERGVPNFTTPEGCAAALDALLRQARWVMPVPTDPAPAIEIGDLPSGRLQEIEGRALFGRFGVPGLREVRVHTGAEAEAAARALGGPVALKMLSRDVAHKTEAGGVALGLSPADVGARLSRMAEDVKARTGVAPEAYVVQEMVVGEVEMLLGYTRDPQVGGAVVLGAGGVMAEIIDDTVVRVLPIGRADAEAMVTELKMLPLLHGFRGRAACDVPALVEAILAFAAMAAQLGERLVEAEINPLIVLPRGQGVRAADAVAVLR